MRTRGVWWVSVAAASLVAAGSVAAQSMLGGGMDLGLAVGVFAEYPHQFSPRFCVQRAGGAAGRVGYGVTAFLKVEATATLTTGVGEEMCSYLAEVAPCSP